MYFYYVLVQEQAPGHKSCDEFLDEELAGRGVFPDHGDETVGYAGDWRGPEVEELPGHLRATGDTLAPCEEVHVGTFVKVVTGEPTLYALMLGTLGSQYT